MSGILGSKAWKWEAARSYILYLERRRIWCQLQKWTENKKELKF